MNVDPMPEDDPTVPIIQGGDPRPLRATQPFRLIRAATPRFRRRRPSPRTSSSDDGRTLAHTSKYDESMAALEDVDRRLLAGEIGRSEHGVRCDELLTTISKTPHARRISILSGIAIVLAAGAVLWLGMLLFGSYIDHLSSYL
jgi:hypothetical protein